MSQTASTSVTPAPWHKDGQKVVTNVISIRKTQEAMDKTFELLKTFMEKVKMKEPGALLFLLNRDDEHFQYVTYEIYKDQEAVAHHLHTPYMKELIEGEDVANVKRAENEIHHETLVAQIGLRE